MRVTDTEQLISSLRMFRMAAQAHEDSSLSTALLTRPPSAEPLIPTADKYQKTEFLNTQKPEINIAWDYLIRDPSVIYEYGEQWIDTQTEKHFPILLQPPSQHIKPVICKGLSLFFKRFQIEEEDACLVNCGSPLVMRVNAGTQRGLALYDAIIDAKSDLLVSKSLSKNIRLNDIKSLQNSVLNPDFEHARLCPDDLLSFLARHKLTSLPITPSSLPTDDSKDYLSSHNLTPASSRELAMILISYQICLFRSNSLIGSIIKGTHKL